MSDFSDEELDFLGRMVPEQLAVMRAVWNGRAPYPGTLQEQRVREQMEKDRAGFMASLNRMEELYQKQLIAASSRDRRIAQLEEENAALVKQLEEMDAKLLIRFTTGDKDAAEEKILDLIDRTRNQFLEQPH